MISRRATIAGLVSQAALLRLPIFQNGSSAEDENPFDQLIYPPFGALNKPETFGYNPATEEQKKRARQILGATPKGPKPLDVAQSFVDRFYQSDPKVISQWPAPDSWNPLIVEFFNATGQPANNDMIPWCAAFANWCLEHSGRKSSRNASSQSFLSSDFKQTADPEPGDLAIFTCYDKSTGKSLGLGHVTFFKEKLPGDQIRVVGGNQSGDGHSSVISATEFVTTSRAVKRHVGDNYVLCTMRLNTYVRIV